MYRSIDEVEKALADRSYAESVMSAVSKGSKGKFNYVPWNETAKLLTRIFGSFGWSARIVGSHSDTERGIYRTDLELDVYAMSEHGQVMKKTLPGTGGCVASPLSHDDAMKSSRSDALSVAAKSLGDAFGLYLYDKGDPARTEPVTNNQSRTAAPAPKATGDLGPRPTAGQLKFGASLGWSEDDFNAMAFKEWKAILDEKKRKPAANKVAPVKSQDALVEELFG